MVVSVVDVSAGGAWVSPQPQAESMAMAARRVNFVNESLPRGHARSNKQQGTLPKVPWIEAVTASNHPEAKIDHDLDRACVAAHMWVARHAFGNATATTTA